MSNKLSARTIFDKQERYHTPTGSQFKDEYEYKVNSRGQKELVKTGQKNVYAEIQSYAEECKIENILKRVAVGDMTDFRANGIYADTTTIPNNLIDAKKAIVHLENTWNKLPIEIKEKYNNSVEEFIGKAGTKAWRIDMGLLNPEETTIKTPTIDDTVPETKIEVPESKNLT